MHRNIAPDKLPVSGRFAIFWEDWHMTDSMMALFRHLFLIAVSFIILYPIVSMLSMAFKPFLENYDPSVIWIPREPTLQNFIDAIQVMQLDKAVPNTLIYTIVNTLIQVVVCMITAYGFARFKFRGKKLLFMGVLLTIVVPPQTISTSLFAIFNQLGLIGSFWPGWLPSLLGVGFRSGLYIYIYHQFFIGLPVQLEEAAAIDGCSAWSTFTRIMVPNAKNITITVFLFSLVWNVNDFFTSGTFFAHRPVMATALSNFQSNLAQLATISYSNTDPRIVSTRVQAACLILLAPLLLIYVFTQRYFTESIETSGLTGM